MLLVYFLNITLPTGFKASFRPFTFSSLYTFQEMLLFLYTILKFITYSNQFCIFKNVFIFFYVLKITSWKYKIKSQHFYISSIRKFQLNLLKDY